MKHRSLTTLVGSAVLALVAGIVQASNAAAVVQPNFVTIAGDLDSEIGCPSDWQPGCAAAHLTLQPNGVWSGTFTIPAGSYQYKAALNDSWDPVNYGAGGGGGNVSLTVPATGPVTFYFDPVTHWVTDSVASQIVTAVGDFQTHLGCPANSAADCAQSWLQDLDGDGIYTVTTSAIPAGTYHARADLNFASTTSYGAGGVLGGPDIAFTVPAGGGGATTVLRYDPTTHLLTITSTLLVQAPPATFGHPTAGRGDVIANLFEWNWPSVANECTTVLGPAGYGTVQVAPPQNSLSKTDAAPIHPWWEVYQPVDYNLTSRMGNEAQFKSMVATCRKAGVKVIVDAVINHMTGGGGPSYGGTTVTKYEYPGLYSAADFHSYPADCPRLGGVISDFNNFTEVTKCELVSLSDLRTESNYVRTQIAGYLNKLLSYGVSGFRVDAAKHIGQTDLAAIEAKLHRTVDGTRPYIALEVPPGGPGRLGPFTFEQAGNLLGFDFASQVRDGFNASIADFKVFGEAAGLLPSKKSLAFVENHDSERNGSTLSYKNGPTNTLATEFMLGYGYGTPEVYAGFAFANNDDSPPADAAGFVTNTDCNNGWACTDRSIGVANMVDWHNYVGAAPVTNWYDNTANLIAFSRGHRGWIALNNETTPQTKTFTTGLARGTYCDIAHGSYTIHHGIGSCSGPTITVDSHGKTTVTIAAKDAVAFDAANKVKIT